MREKKCDLCIVKCNIVVRRCVRKQKKPAVYLQNNKKKLCCINISIRQKNDGLLFTLCLKIQDLFIWEQVEKRGT